MTVYRFAVLRCDHSSGCTNAIDGENAADCRRRAKAAGWKRVPMDGDLRGARTDDICPAHNGRTTDA